MADGSIYGYKLRPPRLGNYRITGTIDELGTPGPYRVRLYLRYNGQLIRARMSSPDGTWSFDWIPYREAGYFVTGHDHSDPLRHAAIVDYITPEPMPT